ncbi:2-dehydropantoate 2-reductase [Litoreibacter roseus]|uniref:2-dehydropantoate 2-reductase n=1 Tax=Litoreibacter roseus TaxID=2601869 RepID=A0A6N6JJQ8_9RHOB|nr:2-dehydropantoate 2-reductase [Litoreibacter roseus]GFE66090.1 2-dehydropantoate 2-reductase [Litoreibacter roseus]
MIVVFGAGAIGCFVGGMLAASGTPVTLIGRAKAMAPLEGNFTVCALGGQPMAVPAMHVTRATEPGALAQASTVLVCVKSGDTKDAARAITACAPQNARVISLQNGVTNATTLAGALGAERVTAGMFGFNVIQSPAGSFSQVTEGEVVLGETGADLVKTFQPTEIHAATNPNIEGIQWTKLLMNLNNALNLLSGIGLKTQLQDRQWRRVLSVAMSEGIAVARADGVRLERVGKVHPKLLPSLLRLPDILFSRVANAMLRIDPAARSSMVADYHAGRPSEIAWLNGFIVDRAAEHGLHAPVNTKICQLVNSAFAAEDRVDLNLSAGQLLQ